ncbi:hypothetical protein SL054_002492 [Flavobacterium psychrophilum]|jgi:hypothetical protein|uniref:hypothetical protein n=1 Tax=Flavobacterium psychrophilum TaxID=96345 RepID=UPI001C8F73D4|nr:hypothetical protein [Flavobacterium psychrophilum]EKT4500011.1 hypothetical protein [Flavobacterium psychrophilum]ELM3651578.1 hypothetical protein [Flavobacterium psychrophilum]ELM3672600.1 hypothetical protein [Flavobacterium psychrophilum]ELM3727142.1 hypothetical protein [Flavobacterium psychrophilum]ELY1993123.1 hypothetical protein [Flavobacterium psychrophilum]
MIHIIIKDNKNKVFEILKNLREETELLICQNINTINGTTPNIQIETYVDDIETYWIGKGYTIDQSLYDRLILDYNQQNTPLLTRWK